MERCCRHITSTFLAKTSGKEKILLLFWSKITESLWSSSGEFYTFAKLVLFRLLVLVVRDLVITICAIAYNVNNNLDEVLLAIVCIVYHRNIINRSRLAPKVAVTRAFVARGSHILVEETSWIACWRSVSHIPSSLVEDCCFQLDTVHWVHIYWYFGVISLFLWWVLLKRPVNLDSRHGSLCLAGSKFEQDFWVLVLFKSN